MAGMKEDIAGIAVETFFMENEDKLQLKLISGRGSFKKKIMDHHLHRPGLALTGFVEQFTYERIQVCGDAETTYLRTLSKKEREDALAKIFSFDIPCFIVTDNNKMPLEFI